jgi:ubiquinone/menaquinone biosynthesis C-methylase UbiE
MIETQDEGTEHQRLVDRYFQASAPFWKAIYERQDLDAAIYQERRDLVLSMVNGLGIPRDSLVLEIGCGAGLTAVSLAERYIVEAVDTVPDMLDLTRERAASAGVAHRLTTRRSDAHNLAYAAGTFDLALAIGVLPWVSDPSRVLRECARVVRRGGYFIASIDNTWALQRILDPQLNPVIRPLKRVLRNCLRRLGIVDPEAREQLCGNRKFDRLLGTVGLTKVWGKTLGFGPFSLFSRTIIPESMGGRLHRRMQQIADRNCPLIRSAGSHYVVVARKES